MEGGKILLSDDENNCDYDIYDDNDDDYFDECDDYGDDDDPDWDDNGVHLIMTMHCSGVYLIRKFCLLESRFQ